MILSILLLFLSLILGIVVSNYLFTHHKIDILGKFSISYFIGIYLSTWIIFLFALIFKSTFWGITVGIILLSCITFWNIFQKRTHLLHLFTTEKIHMSKALMIDMLFIILAFSFSIWFTNQHFHSSPDGNLLIGQDV